MQTYSSRYLTKGMADLEKHRESDKKEQSHWTIEKHQESCSKLQDQKQSQVLCHHDLDMTHSLWCHDSHKIEWLKITLLWSVYLNWVHCYNVVETSIKGRFAVWFIRVYCHNTVHTTNQWELKRLMKVSFNKHSPPSS